jgi:acetyl-CoA carboxylase biotin carboxyl carrier protein
VARKRKPARRAAAPARVPAPRGAAGAKTAGFEIRELRRLIQLVQRTGIGELELSSGGRSVRISATAPAGAAGVLHAAAASSARPAEAAAPASRPEVPASTSTLKAITSPMVGTFYRSPAPDADPFVETGDVVEVGQTVCIIEAMKLMNEIEVEFKGRVVQVLVENAQPVEFGQKLFLVEPA